MMPDEKEKLLSLLERGEAWCRNAEATDRSGNGVAYDDETAAAWDISGALCRLFGWRRACVLFGQFDRHIHGKHAFSGWPIPDTEMDAMIALQDFNDRVDTTFEAVRGKIETMPVWQGNCRGMKAIQES